MATHRSRRHEPRRDHHAGDLIEALCTERGWSAYDLARQTELIAKAKSDSRFQVSRQTIDRVVNFGQIPQPRNKCGIALALGVSPWQLWGAGAMALPHQQMTLGAAA